MEDLFYKDEPFQIVGAAMEAHRGLGGGFLEAIYQEALEIELTNRAFACCPQKELIVPIDEAQILNYQKTTGLTIGLLINFGKDSLDGNEEFLHPGLVKFV